IKKRSLKDTLLKLSAIFLFFLILSPLFTRAQAVYQPYSYHFYQKFNKVQYNWESRQHTAVKPMIIDSVMAPVYELLMNVGSKERSTWVGRKLWNEHLIDIKG